LLNEAGMPRTLLSACVLSLIATAAFAAEPGEASEPAVSAKEPEQSLQRWQVGLLTGQRALRNGYVFSNGPGGELPFGQGLTQVFDGAPFSGVQVNGVAVETVMVRSHLRLGVGVAKPFSSFRLADAQSVSTEAGVDQAVSVRALALWDLRLSLGAELALGPVTPFVDLVGTGQWVGAELALQGQALSYHAWSFGLGARAGVRLAVERHLYVMACGQVGLDPAFPWAAELAIGGVVF
jgi:hypothetical protein